MAGEFQRALAEVSRELAGASRDVATAMRRVEELAREHGSMRERIAALETALARDGQYGEKEHRELRARLEDGDELFDGLNRAAREATDAAGAARKAADSAQVRVKELRDKIEEAEKVGKSRRWDLFGWLLTAGLGLLGAGAFEGGKWLLGLLKKGATP